jgi:glycine/D-amino acid oxidase-like deaminating enzyme
MSIYGRVSQEALLLGGWERVGQSYDPRKLDLTQPNPSIRSDWGVLLQFERDFAQLAPSVLGAQKSRVAKGWPTFTPDGQFIIGESTAAPGLIMAAGCNAHGISGSAGIGALLLESIVSDSPSDYVKSLSPDRFSGSPDWQDAIKKSRGIYENYYK